MKNANGVIERSSCLLVSIKNRLQNITCLQFFADQFRRRSKEFGMINRLNLSAKEAVCYFSYQQIVFIAKCGKNQQHITRNGLNLSYRTF